MTLTVQRLIDIALSNPFNATIVTRLPALGLNQCMLTAGSIFQAVWNQKSDKPVAWGVSDYDVFYFDEDISWEAENEVINAATSLFQDLNVKVQLRNQARVHVWFEQHFGYDCPSLQSTKQGVDRFLIAETAIGLDVDTAEVYAPYGLSDLERGMLRINPRFPEPGAFLKKAHSYQSRWPWLRIINAESTG